MRIFSSVLVSSGLVFSALLPLSAVAGPVDINTADATTLARELNGIGPARAQAIVAYRNQHGPFKSVDELALVKNIPQKVIDANREFLRMEGGKAPRAESRPPAKADASTVARADVNSDAKPAAKRAPNP